MKVFGLAGPSGVGKTTLMEKLLPWLRAQGVSVSTVKHAHHGFELDQPGKDSFRHRAAGAQEVIISSGLRWALLHEIRNEPEPCLNDLLSRLSPVALVLVEGFKREPYPKIEVRRGPVDCPLLCLDDPTVIAIASDVEPVDAQVPWLPLDDVVAIGRTILDAVGLSKDD
ncbi:Molybdopterin-guanine dinucleotide biosynthesis adapter protein [Azospirillaceae bacterium]